MISFLDIFFKKIYITKKFIRKRQKPIRYFFSFKNKNIDMKR